MKNLVLLLTFLASFPCAFCQTSMEVLSEADFSIGKSIVLHSGILNEQRTINIYLPSSYSTNNVKEYPVIYLLDGSKDEDFIHVSGLVQFCSFSWINTIPESIVIGIGNVDRQRDFTYPSKNNKDLEDFPTSGKSANFIQFIEEELQPYVHQNYRVTKLSTLIGQSLGGLLATEILFTNPSLFTNYIIVSPSLWWDNQQLLQQIPQKAPENKGIYIAGGKEGDVMERTTKELYTSLKAISATESSVYYSFFEDKTHGDVLHVAVYDAFVQLFSSSKE